MIIQFNLLKWGLGKGVVIHRSLIPGEVNVQNQDLAVSQDLDAGFAN